MRFGSAATGVPVWLIGLHVAPGRSLVILADPGEDEMVAEDVLVAPGEQAILDAHSVGGPRPVPQLAVRPMTLAEKQFCALGPLAEGLRRALPPRRRVEVPRGRGQGYVSGLAGIARDYGVDV